MAGREASGQFSTIAAFGRAILLLLVAISMLALVAVVYLWVRSHFIAEVIYFAPVAAPEHRATPLPMKPSRWHYQYHLASSSGRVQVVRRNLGIGEEAPAAIRHLRPDDPAAFTELTPRQPPDRLWSFAGMGYYHNERRYIDTPPIRAWMWGFLIVTVPYWLLALVTAVGPAIFLVRYVRGRRRRRRMAAGLCVKCGYDLRASEGVCPECGAAIPQEKLVRR